MSYYNSLSQLTDDFDFPLHAPVVFDIVRPKIGNLQRILTRVTGISQELFPILSEINGQPRRR